ncbi:hypothetical protein F4604DRAFT_1930845 [Suillus subluteus]|nr:hypothetical protein F4604DRAFT_1930845 [Suillus subluteus]
MNYSDRKLAAKQGIRSGLNESLVEVTENANATLEFVCYEHMVQEHLVKLIGWCHNEWGNPSNLKGGVGPLEALAQAVSDKKCKFIRITRQEADERMKRIEAGEVLTPNKVDQEPEESPIDDDDTYEGNDIGGSADQTDHLPLPTPSSPTTPPRNNDLGPADQTDHLPLPTPSSPTTPTRNNDLGPAPRTSEITEDLIDPALLAPPIPNVSMPSPPLATTPSRSHTEPRLPNTQPPIAQCATNRAPSKRKRKPTEKAALYAASRKSFAASTGLIYDWVLTFGQEVELVWRQRWSLMTFLYLSVRYIGILAAVIQILGHIIRSAISWTIVVINAILGVIMIARLNAMYQQSKKVLIVLVGIFLAVFIADGIFVAIATRYIVAEELIFSGTYQCTTYYERNGSLLISLAWIVDAVWEVVALCFAVWSAVKHFRELRRWSAGGIVQDCFTVLMKSHIIYFASFVAISCVQLGGFFFSDVFRDSPEYQIYTGFSQILFLLQMFVLGPRLILSIREYHATLVTGPDAGMTSIVFQERVHVTTSSSV